MREKPTIAITMGDPCGVGPEIILRALSLGRVLRLCRPVVVGDEGVLRAVGKKLGLRVPARATIINPATLDAAKVRPGRPTVATGRAMIAYIEKAVRMVVELEAEAVVTCPISKEAARRAGFKFPGHTEFIAHLTRCTDYSMMLGGKDLKVILVTIHEPLAKVPRLVTKAAVLKTIRVTDAAFRKYFGLKRPRIAVAGLNPHAGEGGQFGLEDIKVVAPAVKKARSEGINAVGPLPPDTVFYRTVKKREFDCVVAMYHDQGLGPLKLLHFEDGINATLGLPIIRTSVDHGTAYDIAWKGVASPSSLVAAIETAVEMAKKNCGALKDVGKSYG